MSVYNGEQWLSESIASVLNQTFNKFEFIIINDGSKDSSLKVLKKYASKDQRIKIIDKANTGLTDSLNVGIKYAQGEWIARIDCDDLCEPNRLAFQYAMAETDTKLVLIGSGATYIDINGKIIRTLSYPQKHKTLVQHLIFKNKAFFAHSSAFMKTSAVLHIQGYRTRLRRSQDSDLWLRMSTIGKISSHIKPLVKIRKHQKQVSNEDGGERQIIDSRTALVSYILKQRGYPDPLCDKNSETEFQAFWAFVKKGVEDCELVKFRQFIEQIKNLWRSPDLEIKALALKRVLSNPFFVVRFFKECVFGERLAEKLCEKWIYQKKV